MSADDWGAGGPAGRAGELALGRGGGLIFEMEDFGKIECGHIAHFGIKNKHTSSECLRTQNNAKKNQNGKLRIV